MKDIRKSRGILTMEDLQQYQVRIREPIVADVMGFKIIGMPPPSAGGAVMVLILNILAQYGFLMEGPSAILIHRQIEGLKHVFAVRMNLGDPDFAKVKNVVNDMLSTEFAKQLKTTIYNNMTFNSNYYGGKQATSTSSSSGIRLMIVVPATCPLWTVNEMLFRTSTVNAYFGAKYLSPSTGIVSYNEMDDLSVPAKHSENVPPPAPANFIHPGKRPLSSMTPTIVLKVPRRTKVVGLVMDLEVLFLYLPDQIRLHQRLLRLPYL